MPNHRLSIVRTALASLIAPFAAAAGLLVHAGSTAAARANEVPPISDLVPAHALLVVEIDDCARLVEAAEASSIKAMLEHADFVAFFDAIARGVQDEDPVDLDAILDRLGVDLDELDWPAGRVGYALYETDSAEHLFAAIDADSLDIETFDPFSEQLPGNPRSLLVADLAASSEPIFGALDTIIDYGLDHDWIELQGDHSVGEHEIVVVRSLIKVEHDRLLVELNAEYARRVRALEPDEWDTAWEGISAWYSQQLEDLSPSTGDPVDDAIREAFASFETIAYTRLDDHLVMGESPESVEDVLIAIAHGHNTPASSAPFIVQPASQLDHQALVRLFVNIEELTTTQRLRNELYATMGGYDNITAAMNELLGTSAVKSLGVGLHLDQPGAIAQIEAHLIMDGKRGLLSLMDLHAGPFDPPAFVPADAIMAARLLVDFPRVLEIARTYVQSLPEDQRAMIQSQLQLAQAMVGPILAELGPQVYLWQIATDTTADAGSAPIMFDGLSMAIRTGDPQTLAGSLAGLVSMAGLEGRTFEGAQIYTAPDSSMAVGLGEEWVFVGTGQSVEDALRRASTQAGATLADEPAFREAMADLDADGPVTAYLSLEQVLAATAQAAEASGEPWGEHFPPADLWMRFLGDLSMEVVSTDTGFSARLRIGEPED